MKFAPLSPTSVEPRLQYTQINARGNILVDIKIILYY